ncbi:TPA: hypothetical protein ACH3X1_016705 [Trebouxia sp. C0004]
MMTGGRYTPGTIVIGTAQHAHMESSVNAVVSKCVQNVVHWTRLGKDLERSKPIWQQLVRTNSLESDMLTIQPSHVSNLILHIYALFISILCLTLLCGLQAGFSFGNCLFNIANEVDSLCILDSFLAFRTQGEITRQPRVLAIVEVERGVLSACLVSVIHNKLSTGQ